MRKPIFEMSDQVRHKLVALQEMARSLKFQNYEVEGFSIRVSKPKALICTFIFTYAKAGFRMTWLIFDCVRRSQRILINN